MESLFTSPEFQMSLLLFVALGGYLIASRISSYQKEFQKTVGWWEESGLSASIKEHNRVYRINTIHKGTVFYA